MNPEWDHQLQAAKRYLLDGVKRARQGSYERGAPDDSALPSLLKAREDLYRCSIENEGSAEVWRLIALAEEYLLNYPAAVIAMERVLALAGEPSVTRKDHKKLAQLRANMETNQ